MLISSRLSNLFKSLASRRFSAKAENKMLQVTTLLCTEKSNDNYMYLIVDSTTKTAAIVDPLEPNKVKTAVAQADVTLKSVFTTHHHWDHAGGNAELVNLFPGVTVYGGDDRIDALTHKVQNGDKLKLGNLDVQCFHTPCHTHGHVCYYIVDQNNKKAVFTGDTLFVAGCGKFFEGTGEQMYKNLVDVLGKLPDDTEVYCGHEYAASNLKYAKFAEPNNPEIDRKIHCCQSHQCSVPSTIGQEKLYNPFMRVHEKSLQDRAGTSDPVEVMNFLRSEKNAFRG